MKKLLISALMLTLPMTAMGEACPVKPKDLKLSWWQNNTDDEFLYDKDGNIYECDNEYCPGGREIELRAGHIWQGETIPEKRTYKCFQGSEDRWEIMKADGSTEEYTPGEIKYATKGCGNPIGITKYAGTWLRPLWSQNISDNEFIYANGLVYECDNEFCSKGTKKCFDAGHYYNGEEITIATVYECIGRRKWKAIASGQKCNGDKIVPSGATKKAVTSEKPKGDEGTDVIAGAIETGDIESKPDAQTLQQKCESSMAGASGASWIEGKCACSKYPHNGKEYARDFDPSTSRCVLPADVEKCIEVEGADWDYGLGKCVCTDSDLTYDSKQKKCVKSAVTIAKEDTAAITKIRSAYTQLQALEANLGKVTVWKTEDGKFNTSRLVSDSVAGVVLGTTGALVTSHLVKKKQVEDGFEDIQCVVGGQVVADWGDSFNVGIKN